MKENHIRMLCSVIKVDLVYETKDGMLTAFFDSVQDSPLMADVSLRETLREKLSRQAMPVLRQEEGGVFFAALHAEGGTLYMGPMCSERMRASERRQFYTRRGIEAESARHLPVFTLPEIRNMVLLVNSTLENAQLENEELLQLNRLVSAADAGADKDRDQLRFLLNEEAEDDDSSYRHSYYEEKMLMQAIRDGRGSDAVRLAESMDADTGRLSRRETDHWRTLAIIGISLCTRAAIEAGVPPEAGYRMSGYYIQKCDASQDPAHLLHYRNRAIEDLATFVRDARSRTSDSGYVEQCRDYVRKHYREKIYLDDVAAALGLSPSYLSRLFHKETGKRLQDYINEERVYRAANLLMYSDYSLSEIAEYVHFPSQSYFGKVFREVRGVTPRAFREQYRAREAFRG